MRIIVFVFTLLILLTPNIYCQSYEWKRVFTHEYKYDIDVASNGYLYTCGGGVFRSTDEGNTWAWIGTPDGGERNMTIDHNDVIYTGKAGQWQGIYKSTDYGNSWSICYNGYVATRSMHTTKEGYIYIGDAYGLFIKSTDSGLSWSADTVTYRDIISITTTSNGQIFLCTEYGPIYTSTDFGDNWTELPSPGNLIWPAQTITADSNDYLYTSRRESGIGISTDYGLTWNIYDNFPSTTSSSVVAIDSLQNIYFAYGQVHKSTDGGLTWVNMLGPNWVQSILTVGEKIYLATYSGIYRYDPSTPGYIGNNYMPMHIGNTYQYVVVDGVYGPPTYRQYSLRTDTITNDTLINNNTYYLLTTAYYSAWLRYSEEDKKLYTWVNNSDEVYMDFIKVKDETLYQYNVMLNGFHTAYINVDSIYMFGQVNKYKGWGCSVNPYPFRVSYWEEYAENIGIIDYGHSNRWGWRDVYLVMAFIHDTLGNRIDLTGHYKPNITLNPVTVISDSSFELLFQVTHPLGGFFINSIQFESFYKKNDSVVFNPVLTPVYTYPNYNINFLVDTLLLKDGYTLNYRIIANDEGLIQETSFSPDSGYYQCVWDFTSDITKENQNPEKFSLKQNYPNPFNPITKISWQSPVGSWQTLKVYDILGNEVVTLVNEYRNSGSYETEFNASYLASGIYYYQLRAGDYIETKKMILLR